MTQRAERDNQFCFSVSVVPRARRSEVVGEHDKSLRVRLGAVPVDGKANEELVRTLAEFFNVPQRAVEILSEATSKRKRVSITGVQRATFERKLQALKIA